MPDSVKKIVFIVNPKAGITPKSKVIIELLAGNIIPKNRFTSEVIFTERAGHATEIAAQSRLEGADIIVASGGDGTVNEVAGALSGGDIPMGILPAGSGNGLARCLGISMSYALALRTIMKANTQVIDTAEVNGTRFTSIAGIGFDAHVASKFAESSIRGMISYMQIILNEYSSYKPATYKITLDGTEFEKQALMVVFANSNQFGFNTRIAPDASLNDGLLDVCIIRKMPVTQLINMGYQMMAGNTLKSGYAEYYKAKNIRIETNGEPLMNIDGEPRIVTQPVEINIIPQSLKVIVP
jgi:YegS/Rv2252/BmrU family lipid kinase